MKSDIDALMQKRGLDALLVTGPARHNPFMVYFTGIHGLLQADLIKVRGREPVLFHHAMERDEAAQSGLETISYSQIPMRELIEEAGGKHFHFMALRYREMFSKLGLTSGRVAVYGQTELGPAWATFATLRKFAPQFLLVGEGDNSLLLQAMQTKDAGEVAHIRRMAEVTTTIADRLKHWLSTSPVRDETLYHPDGQPLRIGDVKRQISLWLTELGGEDPDGFIFAQGRDAGVPHSAGTPDDPLRLGRPIVFDFSPCEAGGGYFSDFTRTWCLGYAPVEVQKLYDQVRSVYEEIVGGLEIGTPCAALQRRVCELFQAQGHPTVLEDPVTERGYVHGLGHGVGLHIHEKPWYNRDDSPDDVLQPGTVTTIEPGLYYPEREMGVRLEDTYWVSPEGDIEVLAAYPMDLVVPMGD